MDLLYAAIRLVHILVAAALLGAMSYSIFVVQSRGRQFFSNPREFEEFTAFISHGARWKMLVAVGLLAASGVALVLLRAHEARRQWTWLITAKAVVLLAATLVFSYASWKLWPSRIFALRDEISKYQRQFRVVGFAMLTMIMLEFILSAFAQGQS